MIWNDKMMKYGVMQYDAVSMCVVWCNWMIFSVDLHWVL